MKLVQIREDTLVNPDMISVVEIRKMKEKRSLVITMSDGKQLMADVDPMSLMQDLIKAGLDSESKMWQFWAG